MFEIKLTKLGQTMEEGTITGWMKKVGLVVAGLVALLVVVLGVGYAWASSTAASVLAQRFEAHTIDFPVPFPLTDTELAALRAGNALVWFPEGARSKTGALEPFLPGIGLLLEHTDVPVLPVYIEGAHQAWPMHRRWPRPRPITVHIGAPIKATELLAGPGPGQPHERAARALREAVSALIRARLAGPPAP